MKTLATFALALCAVTPTTYGGEPFRSRPAAGEAVRRETVIQPVAFAEPVFDPFKAERAAHWQAELAARELEIRRAQTAWLPPAPVGPIRSEVVRDRPTYSNALFAVNRPYAFVPEPYYEMPNSDRRLIAYQWYPYAPAPYFQPDYTLTSAAYYPARAGFPRGPAEVAVQPVTPGPGPTVAEREAALEIRAASADNDRLERR